MFASRLRALGYSRPQIDVAELSALRHAVGWLEGEKIGQLAPDEREQLSSSSASDAQWADAFLHYLGEMDCPLLPVTAEELLAGGEVRVEIFGWLVSRAVAIVYNADADSIQAAAARVGGSDAKRQLTSAEFRQQLESVARSLDIPIAENTAALLRTVARDLQRRVHERRDASMSMEEKLHSFSPGFSSGDPIVDQAAMLLRLLYISNIRDLQTEIDHIIVMLQQCTANPKTNAALARVGR